MIRYAVAAWNCRFSPARSGNGRRNTFPGECLSINRTWSWTRSHGDYSHPEHGQRNVINEWTLAPVAAVNRVALIRLIGSTREIIIETKTGWRSKSSVSFPVNFAPRYHSLSLVVSPSFYLRFCQFLRRAGVQKNREKEREQKPIDSCRFCCETFESRLTPNRELRRRAFARRKFRGCEDNRSMRIVAILRGEDSRRNQLKYESEITSTE